jgi:exonuclease SbcD
MRVLHTSDWHLGRKLVNLSRDEEIYEALQWLLGVIEAEGVDVLVVAGDIFDVASPPSTAEHIYYDFLSGLVRTNCRHVVITGGNHDAPGKLEAPRELLSKLGFHIRGKMGVQPEDDVIRLHDQQGRLEAVVAAIPFIRERDIPAAVSGLEGAEDRVARIRQGIRTHYERMGLACSKVLSENGSRVPIIGTGHLFATGSRDSKENSLIYAGNLENLNVSDLPAVFDYLALGHIHRAQSVGLRANVWYSGSLIPLDFNENPDKKVVLLVDFSQEGQTPQVKPLEVPRRRELRTVSGSLESVVDQLEHLWVEPGQSTWVRVLLTERVVGGNPQLFLNEKFADRPIQILQVSYQPGISQAGVDESEIRDFAQLTPEDIFTDLCQSRALPEADMEELTDSFRALLSYMQEESGEDA